MTSKPANTFSLKKTVASHRRLFASCANDVEGIAGVKRQLSVAIAYRLSDDVMQALIRDIQLARRNIEMVFYIWQRGGMADQVAESLMAAAATAASTAGLCWIPRVASLSSAAHGRP